MPFIKFNKKVTYNDHNFFVEVYATLIENKNENIRVEVYNEENERVYTYNTNRQLSDSNRFVNAVKEAVTEYISRQYYDIASNEFKDWNGVIKDDKVKTSENSWREAIYEYKD